MDGVVGVTQNAIPSGANFTYQFEVESTQSGTFWSISYHSTLSNPALLTYCTQGIIHTLNSSVPMGSMEVW